MPEKSAAHCFQEYFKCKHFYCILKLLESNMQLLSIRYDDRVCVPREREREKLFFMLKIFLLKT